MARRSPEVRVVAAADVPTLMSAEIMCYSRYTRYPSDHFPATARVRRVDQQPRR
jgi:hypothetical protein